MTLLSGASSSPYSFWHTQECKPILVVLTLYSSRMVSSIVLPIKKVFSLVDSVVSVEIKDEQKILKGRLVAVDEYLNLQMENSKEYTDEHERDLGTVVIRGNNILSIAPVV